MAFVIMFVKILKFSVWLLYTDVAVE